MKNTFSLLRTPGRKLLVPALLFVIHVAPALAAGDDSTNSKIPDCPRGQVYDSKTKQCVSDKTARLSDEDKTRQTMPIIWRRKATIRPRLPCWIV